jgi:hypothetical protein
VNFFLFFNYLNKIFFYSINKNFYKKKKIKKKEIFFLGIGLQDLDMISDLELGIRYGIGIYGAGLGNI